VIRKVANGEEKPAVLKSGEVQRICALTKKKVISADRACYKFTPGTVFHCDYNNIWLYPANCEHRRSHGRCPKRCHQWTREVEGYVKTVKPERIKVEEPLKRIKP
jgi:hypothetical protein